MMQTKGKRLSFGAWKLDPGLQHLWNLLSISGDLPSVAFDGLDHSSGWMEHLIGSPILLYFESINELMSMLVDLRVVMDKKIRAFPYATDNLIAHGARKIVGQARTMTTEGCAIIIRPHKPCQQLHFSAGGTGLASHFPPYIQPS
jgi:hypothetical protein